MKTPFGWSSTWLWLLSNHLMLGEREGMYQLVTDSTAVLQFGPTSVSYFCTWNIVNRHNYPKVMREIIFLRTQCIHGELTFYLPNSSQVANGPQGRTGRKSDWNWNKSAWATLSLLFPRVIGKPAVFVCLRETGGVKGERGERGGGREGEREGGGREREREKGEGERGRERGRERERERESQSTEMTARGVCGGCTQDRYPSIIRLKALCAHAPAA